MQLLKKDLFFLWPILFIFFLLKLSLVDYGLPYVFHPDEVYIYKTPFKIWLEYLNFNFSSTTNLLFWILPIWYMPGYLVGLLMGSFDGWNSFQQALIAESSFIIFWGRLLSLIVSFLASYVLIRLWYRLATDKIIKWGGTIIILCNPIEWVSDQWIKFDPYCYFFIAIIINISYAYFVERKQNKGVILYLVCSLAVSMRIDLIVPLIIFLAADFFIYRKSFREMAKPVGLAILIYAIITFSFVSLTKNILTQSEVVKTGTSFEEAIVTKYADLLFNGGIIETILINMNYYLVQISGLVLLPVLVIFLLVGKTNNIRINLIIYSMIALGLFLPILPFPYFAPHYFLMPATVLIFLSLLIIQNVSTSKLYLSRTLSIVCAGYFISQIGQIVVWKNFHVDTRIQSREFLLSETSMNDVIALEDYLNPGYYPPIDECSDVLYAKAEAVKQLKIGTGEGFKQKAMLVDSTNCRRILEISSSDRFKNATGAAAWINNYDAIALNEQKPYFLSSRLNYFTFVPGNSYQEYIRKNFVLDQKFIERPKDMRINLLFDRENYFPSLFIYRSVLK